MRASSKRTCCFGLIVCAAVLLCLTHVPGQSGRKGTKKSVPAPKPQETAPEPEAVPITAIIITGHDIDPDMKEVWSNDTSSVAEACRERLKEDPKFSLTIGYGGKMTKPAAVELAKKEKSSYVLWFGYRSKLVGLDYVTHYLDYVVFMPQTAKNLTEGRVYPASQRSSADPGGIIRVPTRTNRNPETNRRLLRRGGEQIAERIKGVL
jgi:hypothetical protein